MTVGLLFLENMCNYGVYISQNTMAAGEKIIKNQ